LRLLADGEERHTGRAVVYAFPPLAVERVRWRSHTRHREARGASRPTWPWCVRRWIWLAAEVRLGGPGARTGCRSIPRARFHASVCKAGCFVKERRAHHSRCFRGQRGDGVWRPWTRSPPRLAIAGARGAPGRLGLRVLMVAGGPGDQAPDAPITYCAGFRRHTTRCRATVPEAVRPLPGGGRVARTSVF